MATKKKNSASPAKKSAPAKKALAIEKAGKTVTAKAAPLKLSGKARTVSSKAAFTSRVFWVTRDRVSEPGNATIVTRDVIRHNGSVVILAIDTKTNPADPNILLIRQYRHAAGKLLLELPAGRIEPGEKLAPAAKRELIEETGYRAKKWSKLIHYYASPGFLTEAMNILLAEDLTLGEAAPEDDEKIEIHMTPLSEVLRMIQTGKIEDGKTLIGILFFASRFTAGMPAFDFTSEISNR